MSHDHRVLFDFVDLVVQRDVLERDGHLVNGLVFPGPFV